MELLLIVALIAYVAYRSGARRQKRRIDPFREDTPALAALQPERRVPEPTSTIAARWTQGMVLFDTAVVHEGEVTFYPQGMHFISSADATARAKFPWEAVTGYKSYWSAPGVLLILENVDTVVLHSGAGEAEHRRVTELLDRAGVPDITD